MTFVGVRPFRFNGCLKIQGALAGARPLFERAPAIREKVLGPDIPEIAATSTTSPAFGPKILSGRQGCYRRG
jgi:hypothetical protein